MDVHGTSCVLGMSNNVLVEEYQFGTIGLGVKAESGGVFGAVNPPPLGSVRNGDKWGKGGLSSPPR